MLGSQEIFCRNAYFIEKEFCKTWITIELCDRPNCEPRGIQRQQDHRKPFMSAAFRIGSKEAETPVCKHGAG